MSDLKRDEIDAEAKLQLRAINKEIELMAKTEKARQEMAGALVGKKYGRSALVSWAAGGGGHSKSLEQEQAEAKAKALDMHHESILWYLRMKLGECGGLQASMMKKRIMRGLEKDRNNLAKSRAGPKFDMATFDQKAGSTGAYKTTGRAHLDMQKSTVEDELTPQQVQMFEKEGQDMLKHYQSTLDQVRSVTKSWRCGMWDPLLTSCQNCRAIHYRDIRTADTVGQQPQCPVCAHRAAGGRLGAHHRECRQREQRVEGGNGEEEHGEVHLLCVLWSECFPGGMGPDHLSHISSQILDTPSNAPWRPRVLDDSCM